MDADIRIRVIVQRIVFSKDEWHIMTCSYVNKRGKITVTGFFDFVREGQMLEVVGQYEQHKTYGLQFRAKTFSPVMPKEAEGIEAYLSKGFVKGIGKSYAKRLYEKFGDKTLEIIDKFPGRLTEVEGIGKKRKQKIIKAWRSEKERETEKRETIIALLGLGYGKAMAMKLWSKYKEKALDYARRNPYGFISSVRNYGFQTADKIALGNGMPPDSPRRIDATIKYMLKEAQKEGHCYLERSELVQKTMELIDVDEEKIQAIINFMLEKGRLRKGPEDSIYLKSMYIYETHAAASIRILLDHEPEGIPSESFLNKALLDVSDISYTSEQLRAIKGVFHNPVSIITGGPGTGKTTTLRAIIRICQRLEWKTALAAPTGRAAKRASESANIPAQTIHRLLSYEPRRHKFFYGAENPLPAKFIIIDEMSMVDASLFYSLASAISVGTHLVMIGDVDQLESVGPGAVLSELVRNRDITIFRLSKIIRQKADSMIVQAAHSLLRGEMIDIQNEKGNDFFFIEETDDAKSAQIIASLVEKRLPNYYKIAHDDIQVLTPMHRGILGTQYLNTLLRNRLNPPRSKLREDLDEIEFRPGDRVMQTENNYDLDVYNGDWGKIRKITDDGLVVSFEKDVLYPKSYASQLTLAFATTIHKSQGSEYPAVVLPLTKSHFIMLDRNLIYTAFTRAKKLLILVGNRDALKIATSNFRKVQRNTNLSHYIDSCQSE